ncbi:MAG: TRAP transporter substrate-binding protein DctP [Deltaproteobacteria bacterium]|nr:TRAP transporter substrate-binding protein DctP [Deltaproteobacteria bacterium]
MRTARTLALTLALLAPALAAPAQGRPVTIKLASFVPEGSIWDKNLRQMGDEWRQATGGRVALTVFASGQQGEEATVVSKMRLDVLQGAALTVIGLGQIDPGFNVFAVPFFYDSYDELQAVRQALTPELEKRLEAKGFVLLGWGDAGWLQVFSKSRITTLAELKALPIYTATGDDRMVQWYKANGFQPRPLAFSDIPTALTTGLIEAVPITPIAALLLQWYRTAPHMLEIGISPLVGATIVTRKAWKAMSEADQKAVRTAAQAMQERLRTEVPEQDRDAIAEMQKRGLEVSAPSDPEAWREAGERFSALMAGSYVPAEVFERARAARDAFRREHGAAR